MHDVHDVREGPDELRLRAAFEELRVALFQATEELAVGASAGVETAFAARDRRRRRSAPAIEYGLILAGLVSLTFTRHRITSDGRHRFDALSMLLSGEGLSHDRYSLVGPLFATPMWWLGKVAGGPQPWLRYYNLALFGLALLALFLLLRGRVDPVLLRRFLLLLVAGSMVPAHVPDFYGETFTAMTVGVGFLVAYAAVSHPAVRALGWVAIILGTANTPGTLPPLGLAVGDRSASTRRVRYMLAVVVSAALILGEARLRRGGPLDQGYGNERFDFPVVLGVLAIGLSFGKGLVFFVPGLFLPVRRRLGPLHDPRRIDLYRAHRSWLLFVAGMVLVYANWWAWSGDQYWGPRFFLFAVFPAALALAAWLARPDHRPLPNLVLLGVLALSVWVAADSTVFETLGAPRCYQPTHALEDMCRFGVRESDLWYPLQAWPTDLGIGRYLQLAYHAVVFGCLAGPVAGRLATAVTDRLRREPALRPGGWRW